jgi:hypothetical protein
MDVALGIAAAALPVAGFLAQYRQTHKDKRDVVSTGVSFLVVFGAVGGLLGSVSAGRGAGWLDVAAAGVAVAVQLALLELVTRLRREQRMLPSSCYLRISFRWKYLQRYFWQWDDFPSYLYFLAALGAGLAVVAALGRVVPGVAEALAGVALLAEAGQAAPQWWRNRREGVEGLSRVAVGLWLAGALAAVAVSAAEGFGGAMALLRLASSVAQAVVLMAIVYQLVAYKRKFKSHDF